jgi:hypothetical protein
VCREFALGWQPIAGMKAATLDQPAYISDDLL